MIVLGIDPSYTATGYAVLAQQGNQQKILKYGFLPLPSNNSMQNRIGLFYDFLKSIVIEFHVTRIVLETPFLGKNAQVFLKLGYLRGVLHLIAFQHNLELLEFSPREIKMAITGFGAAQKDQVSRMIHMLFPGLSIQKSHDITDAIAIALCGLWHIKKPV